MKQESTLHGIKVVEICNVAAGPFCSMLLADMGAEVIKIENPNGGDTLRSWPPFNNDYSENFASLNRNKKSITLDLKDPVDADKARHLMSTAHIVLENNRPGVMNRLGLGYSTIKELNSSVVYCSISAYGQSGPRSQEGGFDLTIQAMSGLMSVTGEPEGAPVKCGVPVCDFSAGLYAAFAIVSALRAAEQTGVGTHIDISMLGATLGIAALQTSEYFGSGSNPRKLGSAHPRNAPYQVFRCLNGYFGMAAGNNSLWKAVCNVVKRPELYDDERFTSTVLRAKHQYELLEILEEIFIEHEASYWLQLFQDAGVPSAPINQYSDILADEQVAHMNWVQDISLPNGQQAKTFASPIRFDGQTSEVKVGPPALGEHNDEILSLLSLQGDNV